MDDLEIIELYWARNQDAITETERSYGKRLQGLSQKIVRSYEDAQECVSDTYMKAWETIPPQKPNFFFAYLARICRYFSMGRLDWKNAAKRKAEVVSLSEEMALCIPDESREREMKGKEIGAVMDRFLEGLSQESRLIFLRRYWFCDTVAEIAGRYGISESKVKTRLHRTRAQLSDFLQKEDIRV